MYIWYVLGVLTFFSVLLACWAQIKVSTNYSKYSKVFINSELTASMYAKRMLSIAGIDDVKVVKTHGTMTDYYNHRKKVLALSTGVFDNNSVASFGIMAHEVGHAIQYKDGYLPIKIRNFLIPVANACSWLVWPLLIIGVLLDAFMFMGGYSQYVIMGALVLVVVPVLINLVTLPVEINASKRAVTILQESGYLDATHLDGAKKVLSAAALTYLASFILSLINMLRFILIFVRRD
ncbi:MAG: zinc metallopeptidase [Clostridia bacterium]|nr:zinc metallopeptidase [Clostridia bacterium]